MTAVHPIVHVDIPVGDLDSGPNFYRDVFGWDINTHMPTYPMYSAEGGPGGGFVKPDAHGEGVLLFLLSSDINGSLREIESHGGSIVTPRTEIEGGHGSFAVFRDPSGTKLGLYQAPAQS